ncbi:hypothetical protein, variant [Aphanomyces invadans]|uniref:Uncharacterized protein n=1 Tax=Aphanomyces invadans TaxID=157072 RepID=A0A024UE27_9STRA|nr:hypothetical protein, variant [Aphanomyces invadans]ETW04152.1 hypothetical protein, variant [Aphanomyces invadans]|eukprot:XP_008867108.1 hypothetical protein, variant [Aphanomyces invadans]
MGLPTCASIVAKALVALGVSMAIAVAATQSSLSPPVAKVPQVRTAPPPTKPQAPAKPTRLVKATEPPRRLPPRRKPRLRPLKHVQLVHSLQLWVQQVLYQLHPGVSIIPAPVLRSLAIPHPPLHRLIFCRHVTASTFDPRQLVRKVQSAPLPYACIHRWLVHVVLPVRRRPPSSSCSPRPLHVIAKLHIDNAVRLIQGFVRSRFAVMLLASKQKYFSCLVHSTHLDVLGQVRRAAILIQAAWRHFQSGRFWRVYSRVYRIRLLVLANRLRRSRQTLAMTPHVKEVYPILVAKWFNVKPANPTSRVWFCRRPSIVAITA